MMAGAPSPLSPTMIPKVLYDSTPGIPVFNPAFRSQSSVFISGQVCFPILRDVGDVGDFKPCGRKIAALQIVIVSDRRPPGVERSKSAKPTSRPSACVPQPETPPPIALLLKTKAKVQFERPVK